jgi:YrbI family 3-deoxy-D-manno-octulosonate 8-phosphate phosphatase
MTPAIVAIVPAASYHREGLLTVIGGIPLIAHTITQARHAGNVNVVHVVTDDPDVAKTSTRFGAMVVSSATRHPSDHVIVMLDPMMPVRTVADVDEAIELFRVTGAERVVSVCDCAGPLWNENETHPLLPAGALVQHDSISVFRSGGGAERTRFHAMSPMAAIYANSADGLALCRWALSQPRYLPRQAWPDRLDLLVFDFDGVLTDNKVTTFSDGSEAVVSDRGDGWGIARLRDAGIPMLVLSTEANEVVAARCRKLQLPVEMNLAHKAEALDATLKRRGLAAEHVMFVGNDINDRDCLLRVGWPVLVGDCHASVEDLARLRLTHRGGDGAVRELADLLLQHLAPL